MLGDRHIVLTFDSTIAWREHRQGEFAVGVGRTDCILLTTAQLKGDNCTSIGLPFTLTEPVVLYVLGRPESPPQPEKNAIVVHNAIKKQGSFIINAREVYEKGVSRTHAGNVKTL